MGYLEIILFWSANSRETCRSKAHLRWNLALEQKVLAWSSKINNKSNSWRFSSFFSDLILLGQKLAAGKYSLNYMHWPQRILCNYIVNYFVPDIVQFYNQIKSGVDTLDKIRRYSSKQKYCCWPVHVFFALVDCRVCIAFQMSQQQELGTQTSHYKFWKDLAISARIRRCFPCLRMKHRKV